MEIGMDIQTKYMCEPTSRFLSVFLINTELNTAVKLLKSVALHDH